MKNLCQGVKKKKQNRDDQTTPYSIRSMFSVNITLKPVTNLKCIKILFIFKIISIYCF